MESPLLCDSAFRCVLPGQTTRDACISLLPPLAVMTAERNHANKKNNINDR